MAFCKTRLLPIHLVLVVALVYCSNVPLLAQDGPVGGKAKAGSTDELSEESDEDTTSSSHEDSWSFPVDDSISTAAEYLARVDSREGHSAPVVNLSETEIEKIVTELRKRSPLVSIRERLNFQRQQPTPKDSNGYSMRRRNRALYRLHSSEVNSFITRQGQGISRTTPVNAGDLYTMPQSYVKKIASVPLTSDLRAEAPVELDKQVKMIPSRVRSRMGKKDPDWEFANALSSNGLPKQQRLSLFNRSTSDSFADRDSGYVKSVDEVAGFEHHKIRLPKNWGQALRTKTRGQQQNALEASEETQWKVNRLELVSLLMNDDLGVYVTDELPNMELLTSQNTPIRGLTAFETEGMEKLQSGEELHIQATKNRIIMLGAIRASEKCTHCHTAKKDDLLGAFSYEFRRSPRLP